MIRMNLCYVRHVVITGFILGLSVGGTIQSWADETTGDKRDASQKPLSKTEKEEFLKNVSDHWLALGDDVAQGIVKKFADRIIVPTLFQLIQDDAQPNTTRLQAMRILGETRDAQGIPVLRGIIDKYLKENMSNDLESTVFSRIYHQSFFMQRTFLRL